MFCNAMNLQMFFQVVQRCGGEGKKREECEISGVESLSLILPIFDEHFFQTPR
jgi:hypothetical protein